MPITLKVIHKKDSRFINGKIYIIKWNKYFYIGSTVLSLSDRLKKHIHDLKYSKFTEKHKLYNILKNIDLNELKIELIENWSCDNQLQLLNREGFWNSYYNSIENEYGLNYRYAYRSPIYNHIKNIKFALKKRGLTLDDNEFYKLLVKCKKIDNSSQNNEYYITNIKNKSYYINMKKQEYIDILKANDSGLTNSQKETIPNFIDNYYLFYKKKYNQEEPNLIEIFNNIDFIKENLDFTKKGYSGIYTHIRNIDILNEQFTFLNENTINILNDIRKENNKRNPKLKDKEVKVEVIEKEVEVDKFTEEYPMRNDKDIQTDIVNPFENLILERMKETKIKIEEYKKLYESYENDLNYFQNMKNKYL